MKTPPRLSLSRLHFPVTALGPGRRLGLWLQGCSRRCPGCLSPEAWEFTGNFTTVDHLMTALQPWLNRCDGLTVSGGEPFDQCDGLLALLERFRQKSAGDILVFTGYYFEEIEPLLQDRPGLIDALMCGPYDPGQPQTLALRGSDNQRLHPLTELGRCNFASYDRLRRPDEQCFDLVLDESGGPAWLAGIPLAKDLPRLREVLAGQGLRK